ncbi:MAG: hypothetical protein UY65_C0017G0011 [Parcubacteria group bacterium GW2011_GWA2_51_12]|nr:MAG: hypothetical protein UY65_C0017G0011 [Parcubacteria group bacterium GW2011_GWA2_51_12]
MILETAPVKHCRSNPGFLGALGQELPGRGGLGPQGLFAFYLEGGGSGQSAGGRVVN